MAIFENKWKQVLDDCYTNRVKKIKVGFFSSLILILLVEIALLSQAIFYPQTKPIILSNITPTQTSIAQQTTTSNDSFNVPLLFTQLEWTEVPTNEEHSLYNDIKNAMLYYDIDKIITSPGREWRTVQQEEGEFENEYDTQATIAGWQQSVVLSGKNLSTIMADGPTGNTRGYVKILDDKVKAIIISRTTVSKTTGKAIAPCPCNYEYRIFVSDSIPVSEIVK